MSLSFRAVAGKSEFRRNTMSFKLTAVCRGTLARWGVFNLVGTVGAVLQLVLLTLLTGVGGMAPVLATVIAVEATLLHNFLLHERWTWRDRAVAGLRERGGRLARFHLLNGLVSMLGNVAIVHLLAVQLGWPVALSGLIAIVACSLLNFFLSHQLVF